MITAILIGVLYVVLGTFPVIQIVKYSSRGFYPDKIDIGVLVIVTYALWPFLIAAAITGFILQSIFVFIGGIFERFIR